MSTTVTPPPKKVNHIGLEVLQYKGGKTTLCAGCGHNSISERIIESFYELGIDPYTVAKFSGIADLGSTLKSGTPNNLPPKKVNHIGLEVLQYKGGKTTLYCNTSRPMW